MKNKTLWIVLGVILALLLMSGLYYMNTYNSLVLLDESVEAQWAQVENQMQRRYDLLPNLVNTVKGYAAHEKQIFENIAESRSKLAGARTPADKMAASQGLEGALSRLLVVVERYPNLKANQNFARLMDELAGTENRMSQERRRYNEIVKQFNITIRSFPKSMIATRLGFEKKDLFQVETAAREVPKVDFGTP